MRAPHFGGLWEASIKSTKFHPRRVIGDKKLTFEELSTVLCQVECCLNSRPLVPLHSHAKDGIDILTPGHFLVGRHMQALPEFNFTQQKNTSVMSLVSLPGHNSALLEKMVRRISSALQQVEVIFYQSSSGRSSIDQGRLSGSSDMMADGTCRVCLPWEGRVSSSGYNTDKVGHLQAANCEVGTAHP